MGEANRKLEEKKKAFEEDPNNFIHRKDVLLGAIRVDIDGKKMIGYQIGEATIQEVTSALTNLQSEVMAMLSYIKAQHAKEMQSSIITPGGGNGKRF